MDELIFIAGFATIIGTIGTFLKLAHEALSVLMKWKKLVVPKKTVKISSFNQLHYREGDQQKIIDAFHEGLKGMMILSTPVVKLPAYFRYVLRGEEDAHSIHKYCALALGKLSVYPYFAFHIVWVKDVVPDPEDEYRQMDYEGPSFLYTFLLGKGFFWPREHLPPCDGEEFLEGSSSSVVLTQNDGGLSKSVQTTDAMFWRKSFSDIAMKKSTRAYLEKSVRNFLSFQTQYDLKKSHQARRMGFLLHGEKGTGKTEVAKSILPEGTDTLRIVPRDLEDLVLILEKIFASTLQQFEDTHDGWWLEQHAPYSDLIEKGRSVGSYQCARFQGYMGSWEEFQRSYDVNLLMDLSPHPVAVIIDDLDRIDFSDTKHLPALLSVIDRIGFYQSPVLLIATTNDYKVIPDVILRPGRFSTLVKFDVFDKELIEEYIHSMWEGITTEQAQKLHALLLGRPPAWVYSMVTESTSIEIAIDNLTEATEQDWIFTPISAEDDEVWGEDLTLDDPEREPADPLEYLGDDEDY